MSFSVSASALAGSSNLDQTRFSSLNGKSQTLAQWRGKVVVVNFWATWCAPCREEMPMLDALRSRWRNQGVEVVGIALDQPVEVQNFLRSLRIGYPVLLGDADTLGLMRSLGNSTGGLPFTVILDRQGKVVARLTGKLSEQNLRQAVEPRL
ncbi:TlpA family protein disulfide reductase [Craterilacuibacter sp.]|uniref:TlpA family protein disulfide reductase n=1 Tax=Craterilacuibacter sp. TaxID=2870909 RepID=UPI003F41B120